jgi:hypothetical protein
MKVKTKSLPPMPSQANAKEPGLIEVDGMGPVTLLSCEIKTWASRLLDLEYH